MAMLVITRWYIYIYLSLSQLPPSLSGAYLNFIDLQSSGDLLLDQLDGLNAQHMEQKKIQRICSDIDI